MTAGQVHQPVSAEEADQAFACLERFETLLLAVSGGPDSLALLYLVAEWAKRKGLPTERLFAATVDHQLRAESAAEAALVAEHCSRLGVPHTTLNWQQKPWSGLMAAARDARYDLLASHIATIAGSQPAAVVTAHTLDD
ncbi:MAG: tRNA lysidine(34) synthetase, partial [Hyphomicrobium sp.]